MIGFVLRSRAARKLFIASLVITGAVMLSAQFLHTSNGGGLSPIFLLLFADFDAKAAGWSLAVLVLAVFVPGDFFSPRLLAWISQNMRTVAATSAAVLCAGTLFVYRNHPLSMDEYAQYFQSQVFAAGRVSGAFPLPLIDWIIQPRFQNYFFSVSKSTGAVISSYWPSFSLLLTPFTALGISWACNPLISALTLWAAHRLALSIYADKQAAALVVLLTIASPEFFVNGISYYSMPAHLLANTLFALLLVDPTRSKAWLAGVVGSVALTLHNPFPHLMFALPWIYWVAGRRDGGRMILCLAAGYVPLCLLLGIGWLWFMGYVRHSVTPTSVGYGDLASMWQVLSVFAFPDKTVLLARAIGIAKIWVWAVPGLLILAAAGAWKNWAHPALKLLSVSAVSTLIGYFLVPVDQGHGWGYRYFHSAWIVLPLLAAGALTRTGSSRPATWFEDDDSRAFVVSCAVLMLLIGVTFRAMQVRNFMTFDLAGLPAYAGTERRVVFINTRYSFYGADLVQNDPWLRGDVIRMVSHGREEDARMIAQNFPELHDVYEDPRGSVWSK